MQSFSVLGIGGNATQAGGGGIFESFGAGGFFLTDAQRQVAVVGTDLSNGRVDVAGGMSGTGGSQVFIPVTLTMKGVSAASSLSFQVFVIANGTSPTIADSLSFSPGAGIPSPGVDTSGGMNTAVMNWGGVNFSGTVNLGSLVVTVPSAAYNIHNYSIWIFSAAASGASGSLQIVPGPTNILAVTGLPRKRRSQLIGY